MDGETNPDFEASRKKLEELIARQAEREQRLAALPADDQERSRRFEEAVALLVQMVSRYENGGAPKP